MPRPFPHPSRTVPCPSAFGDPAVLTQLKFCRARSRFDICVRGNGLVMGLCRPGRWLGSRITQVFSNLDGSMILLSSQCREHCKGRCPKTSTTGLIPPFSSMPELQYPSFKRTTCPSGPRDSCECLRAGGKKEGGTSLVWMKWKLPRVVNTLTTSEHFQ